MTLLDEVMTWAAIIKARQACVSVEITTRMKKPVRTNQTIKAEGWIKDVKSKLYLTEGRLSGSDGGILMTASGKYFLMPQSEFTLCETDFVSSPDAIPLDRILTK
jgi:acyl-coenzyme A thioesterase PaaI-like protein